jgi:siroheme synthase
VAAAAAEISLTDRKSASKVVFLSNHRCAEKSTRQWHNTFEDSTLVFYMPGGDMESLQAELLENGLNSEMPCLVVSQAAQPAQKVTRTTVRGLATLPPVAAPSLLIVGPTSIDARADLSAEGAQPEQRQEREELVLELTQNTELLSN